MTSFAQTPGYEPVAAADRKYQGPKYSGRPGRYVGHHWYDDLELLPDDERVMPATRPDERRGRVTSR